MGRGAESTRGAEAGGKGKRRRVNRILPFSHGPLQSAALGRIPSGFAENGNGENPEERSAQEILGRKRYHPARARARPVAGRSPNGHCTAAGMAVHRPGPRWDEVTERSRWI